MFGNSFIDEIFYWKINTKLYNTAEVDLTSKLTSLIKLFTSEFFNIFCLQSQLPGHIHRLVEIIPKMRKNWTHTLALDKDVCKADKTQKWYELALRESVF